MLQRITIVCLLLGLAAGAAADDKPPQPKTLQRVVVTGTRIPSAQFAGASPVTVIDSAMIANSGATTLGELLGQSPLNSFGSFAGSPGSTAQSQAALNLRGLGAERTLVLVDGRRMAGSPSLGAGSVQNLNVIPLAAVARVEILRDGASALYGADAIGGVVNIILRKDIEGLNVTGQLDRPTHAGGDRDAYSLTGGRTTANGNLTFALTHTERQAVYARDRAFTANGFSFASFPANFAAFTPSGPLGPFPDPRCPASLGTQPYPDAKLAPANVCIYNYNSSAAAEASLRQDSLLLTGKQRLSANTQTFFRALLSKVDSLGQEAPAPVFGAGDSFPYMKADNPNNPTNTAAFKAAHGGPYNIIVYYRNVAGGPRENRAHDTFADLVAGLRGDIGSVRNGRWEIGVQTSHQTSNLVTDHLVLRPAFQAAIDDGSLDIFGVNDPNGPAPGVASRFDFTGTSDFATALRGADARLNFDLAQTSHGAIEVVLGTETRNEDFTQDYGAQQNAGNVDGGPAGPDVSGTRHINSAFAEARVPFAGGVDARLAARFDHYSDFGSTTNPKLTLNWKPGAGVLVRASAGTGYRAPDLEELYKPQTAAGFDGGIDTRKCRASGDAGADPSTLPPGHPCNTIVGFPVIAGGNPALQPEESDEWDAGMLWTPLYAFSASLDLYGVHYDNKITQLPIQQILDREADAGGSPYVVRDASGNIVEVKAAFVNLARVRTRGYDLQLESHLDLGAAGKLKTDLQFTRVLLFDTEIVSGDGFVSNLTHVFGNPNRRAQLRVDWRRGRMGAALTGNYIGPLPQADYPHGLPSWTTWDAQYRLRTSWDGQFSIGVRNLFDRDPPHFAELGGYYLNGLQNIYGRVPYLRYSQWL